MMCRLERTSQLALQHRLPLQLRRARSSAASLVSPAAAPSNATAAGPPAQGFASAFDACREAICATGLTPRESILTASEQDAPLLTTVGTKLNCQVVKDEVTGKVQVLCTPVPPPEKDSPLRTFLIVMGIILGIFLGPVIVVGVMVLLLEIACRIWRFMRRVVDCIRRCTARRIAPAKQATIELSHEQQSAV